MLAVAAPVAAQNFDTVQVRTTSLGRGVYMLTGAGGNMGLAVGDDAVFLIDDEYAPLTPKIRAAIAALTPKPVRFVLNTHWHFDHTGGNKDHGEAGALIVAHDNVRKRLSTTQFVEAFNQSYPPLPKAGLPVVTFNDTVTFWLNGDTITAFHVAPAHTDGDAIVYFRGANVVHMGDVFVSAAFPFLDLSSGGSIHGFVTGTERVLRVIDANTKVIPGHGPRPTRRGFRHITTCWSWCATGCRKRLPRAIPSSRSSLPRLLPTTMRVGRAVAIDFCGSRIKR